MFPKHGLSLSFGVLLFRLLYLICYILNNSLDWVLQIALAGLVQLPNCTNFTAFMAISALIMRALLLLLLFIFVKTVSSCRGTKKDIFLAGKT